ncbi:hypothetical protein LY56_02848 [Roseinatronobacter thiooxidans]|uniref:Anti-sigma factor RsiW n=1 Tax=Roseinatronobacter thiooxidans TaxID=121821 RepID=A0A2W7PV33_9RHOB|nr:hypothetical protein [Roseinatronobacter thiooxidans]PZX39316.1 hypothetical protein LY56_02848 [Roseinatronobacter thiooxidans]
MKPEVSDLVLNAFVDGELPSAEAARIATMVASDPLIAQRVAHLHHMKAALSTMSDDLVLPASELPIGTTHTLRGVRGLAAVCVLLLVVFWSAPVSRPAQQGGNLPFMAQHDHWVLHGAESATVVLPESFDWLRPLMHASGFTLVHYAQAGNLQHFGFKGVNACRLSLFVTTQAGAVSPLQLSLTEKVQHAQWHLDTKAFEMIARDMAPARFATVATSLHRNSRDHAAYEAFQIALLQAARLPCTA